MEKEGRRKQPPQSLPIPDHRRGRNNNSHGWTMPIIDKSKYVTVQLQLPKAPAKAGLILRDDSRCGLPVLIAVHAESQLQRDQVPGKFIGGGYWIVAIKDEERGYIETRTSESFRMELNSCQKDDRQVTVSIIFCPHSSSTAPDSSNDQEEKAAPAVENSQVLQSQSKRKSASDTNNFEEPPNKRQHQSSGPREEDEFLNNNSSDILDGEGETHLLYNQEEIDRIDAIEKESLELFPPGRKDIVYANPRMLFDRLQKQIGNKYGFKIEKYGAAYKCTRCETPLGQLNKYHKKVVVPEEKRRKRRTARCGCKFKLNYSWVTKPDINNPDSTCPMFITKATYRHSSGCSGVLPVVLTKKEEELDRVQRGARKLKRLENIPKVATELIEQFRPMFKALAKHPQQKMFLNVLEGLKGVIEGKEDPGSIAAASASMSGKDPQQDNSTQDQSAGELC
mmetsp:Transcript_6241/g.14123  ORF Transcript_6241/g.14123 Transcript_6241/m.14123 type:complete len:451 (+) Transcript_6241:83-1435(+)